MVCGRASRQGYATWVEADRTYGDTELVETLEEVVGDGDCILSDRRLESLLGLEGLQLMTKTGDLDLEVGDGLESHSTFYGEGYEIDKRVCRRVVKGKS